MGWYSAFRLMEDHGGPDKVPPAARERVLKGECDPARTWSVATKQWNDAAAKGEVSMQDPVGK